MFPRSGGGAAGKLPARLAAAAEVRQREVCQLALWQARRSLRVLEKRRQAALRHVEPRAKEVLQC